MIINRLLDVIEMILKTQLQAVYNLIKIYNQYRGRIFQWRLVW